MLCEGMGKFSTKLVKVLAYQKNDYETLFAERAKEEEERLAKEAADGKAKKKKKKEEDKKDQDD